jgi:transposase-like protein
MKNTRILTQSPQRRRFTAEQKASIISEIAEGETVANLARLHEVSESLIYSTSSVLPAFLFPLALP